MNILFITEDHSIRNYGITSVVSQLVDQLTNRYEDINVTVLSIGSEAVEQNPRVKIVLVPASSAGRFWGWSSNLMDSIRQTIVEEKIDIIHIHGLWMASQWCALKAARIYKIPSVVTPHGMLTDWLWQTENILQKLKKKLYLGLVFKPALNPKTVFHAITPIEHESLNRQLPGNPKVIIPNAIEIEEENSAKTSIKPEKQFLFLGRITPIKAVDVLIDAFHQAQFDSEWKLLIAGPEYVPDYVAELKQKISRYGLEDRIIFTGSIYGEQKLEILQKTWAMVIPSYAEVMGMVNLEAAVQRVPSITTYETGLWNWQEGGGLLVHPKVEELTESLKQAAAWSMSERMERGKRSYDLVFEHYSWQTVIPKWRDFYTSLIAARTTNKYNKVNENMTTENKFQDLKTFQDPPNIRGRSALVVQLWRIVQGSLFAWSPQFLYDWRRFLLRLFGAKIGQKVLIRPSARITYPWKLTIGDYSWVGDNVVLYTWGDISIGHDTVISQNSYLCAAGHDFTTPSFDTFKKAITVGSQVWIATDVFVAPGVTISDAAVVGTRSTVLSDLPEAMICYGNPAKPVKPRIMKSA